ncbi:hypothetical protein ACHAXT_002399 [Thalassiosira profunda]
MKGHFAILLWAVLLQIARSFSATDTSSSPSTVGCRHTRLTPDTANEVLFNLLANEESSEEPSLVLLDGLVTKRRAIGKHLVFLDIVPRYLPSIEGHRKAYDGIDSTIPVQAILRRDFWTDADGENGSSESSYDKYHKIIQPGVHVQMTGHAGPSRNAKEAILFCHSANYILANNNPQHLRNVLRYCKDGALDFDEILRALPCISREEFTTLLGLGSNEPTQTFGDLAIEILSRFPQGYLSNPSQLMGSTNAQKVKLLPPPPAEYKDAPSFPPDDEDASGGDVVSIDHVLEERRHMKSEHQQFTLSGWVQNRRRYQGTIAVLELVDEFSSLGLSPLDADGANDQRNRELRGLWKKRIYAVLHPSALNAGDVQSASSDETAELYGNIFCSGARVLLKGHLVDDASNEARFWVKSCRLLRSSWRPSAVKQVLDILHQRKIAVDEAASALELPGGYSQAEDVAKGDTSDSERQWMAAEITKSLQGENSRVGRVSNSMVQSLDAFARAREKYPIQDIDFESDIRAGEELPGSLLRTAPDGSRWQRAKKPQLMFMIDQIADALRSHPEYGKRRLNVIDIGGGKGLLSNHLAAVFGEDVVEVKVVDISSSAVNNGMMTARRRGLQNIRFEAQDATTIDCTGIDVVVALHACGVLSDVALGHAACQGAGFVICPCCFRSNPHLRVSLPADADGGVELVTAEEWLDVDPAQYGHLKQLAELQGDINLAGEAMHTICGLRAAAVDRLWRNSKWPTADLDVSIKTFSVGFSTRNFCLVGSFHK